MSRKSLEDEIWLKVYDEYQQQHQKQIEKYIAEIELWKARCRVLEKQIRTEDKETAQKGQGRFQL